MLRRFFKWSDIYGIVAVYLILCAAALTFFNTWGQKIFFPAFQGENLLYGYAGHMFVVLAFVTAAFSVFLNFIRTYLQPIHDNLRGAAKALTITHFLSVGGIFLTLLAMIINHRFEYQYVWQHSKSDMKINYVLACIWEGQEGSTLLWLFWHSVIALFIFKREKEFQAPVLTIISLAQLFLSMMLLGVWIGKVHIGSDPFGLIRMQENNIGLPWTSHTDYLVNKSLATWNMFHDGRGLNPLLQNYWMTIHPPTLFCGFALTTVPFSYAIAGLWTKRYHDWQKSALPWAFIGVMVLGTGILMGGAWAYESLSFGGFWAWDPVENASFVPWIVLVGAAHVMLLYKQKGQSLFTTFFLCITAFLLIVYSTFLTKSGILSDSSVHAFTDDGLNEELTFFMGFFFWLSVFLLSFNSFLKISWTILCVFVLIFFLAGFHAAAMLIMLCCSLPFITLGYFLFFPRKNKEEELWSREFWMFVGSLGLLAAAVQIIFFTSLPVLDKFLKIGPIHSVTSAMYNAGFHPEGFKNIVDGNVALDKDAIYFYNKWQISFAIVITFLIGCVQYLKYVKTDFKHFSRQLAMPLLISFFFALIVSLFIYYNSSWSELTKHKRQIYILCSILLFTASFAVLANFKYWSTVLKYRMKSAGASIAHIGFGVLLLGIVISTSKKDTISKNTSRMDISGLTQDVDNLENIYLRKGDTLPMGDYYVTYRGHEKKDISGTGYVYFNVDFLKKEGNMYSESFSLAPFIQLNKFMGNAAEPATKHYLHKDIYTYVKFVEDRLLEDSAETNDLQSQMYDTPKEYLLAEHDTIGLENCVVILDSARVDSTSKYNQANENNLVAYFDVFDEKLNRKNLAARLFYDPKTGGSQRQVDAEDDDLGVKLTFADVDSKSRKIKVFASVRLSKKADYMVLQVSIFPGINILWIGCLIMVTGTFIAVRQRKKLNAHKKHE
ncbi:MAG TPA: cytochrome c biogenesis protein CcsA [Bacteroidia bacterium]|jgi:cytochrome c-type biogenesis protein CcmF|nr:cytochrome c biogenesis protein CcsA [Bacteroidia bacterium]